MKFLSKIMATLLAVTLFATGCGGASDSLIREASGEEGPHGIKYAKDQTMRTLYQTEVVNWNPFGASGSANDWAATSHTTEGLMSTDVYANTIPGLAESYTISEDKLVYTFKLREGLPYVNYKMEKIGEMTADDFVAVAKFTLLPDNAITSYMVDYIEGAQAFNAGETDDFDVVGFKAIDDYTLEITLIQPSNIFLDQANYMCVEASFLEEHGMEYGLDHTKLLCIGPYVLTDFKPQESRHYVKNPYYYDADKVYIEEVTAVYNAQASTIAAEMFIRGETDYADLDPTALDALMRSADIAAYINPSIPDDIYQYWYSFCYEPQFGEEYEQDNYEKAIDNENFRQSLFWGMDRERAIKGLLPYPGSELFLVNTIVAPTWANIAGEPYTDMGDLAEITALGRNGLFNAEKALEYKELAMAELEAEGVTFPVKLYMPYNPVTTGWANEIQVLTQQLSELFGEGYVQFVIEAGPSTGFLAAVRRTGMYGFMKLNMGGNVHDPMPFTNAFAEENNWTFLQNSRTPNVQALYAEYIEMLNYAKSISGTDGPEHLRERFEAFAAAEAFLINHALVIPYTSDYFAYNFSRYNRFEGIGEGWKGRKLLAEPLTSEQFKAIYADYLEAQKASRAALAEVN